MTNLMLRQNDTDPAMNIAQDGDFTGWISERCYERLQRGIYPEPGQTAGQCTTFVLYFQKSAEAPIGPVSVTGMQLEAYIVRRKDGSQCECWGAYTLAEELRTNYQFGKATTENTHVVGFSLLPLNHDELVAKERSK